MRQSHLFTKTRKEAPKDEVSKNAQLLIRAGFVHKEMAGVYSFLPLGLRTLNKICDIIREEMNAIGGQELQLTALQDKKVWEASGRWDDALVDTWFKTKLKNDTELGLGFTHEEPLTQLMKSYIRSTHDLPVYAYQIQTKFRNESRAKSGIMRGREFLMKDLYSFSRTAEEHAAFYEKSKQAYMNIFRRVGLGDRTFITFASGGSFAKYSHEFQTVSDAGEDIIYIDEKKNVAINKEIMDDKASADQVIAELGVDRSALVEKKAVEVGNIFSLGTRFSVPLELNYLDASGKNNPVIMGSYGIGPSRLMGVIAELLSDEKGIVWPKAVAPFSVHLIALLDKEGQKDKTAGKVATAADKLYADLTAAGIDVLYDDRDHRAGEKFADSDLIGIPTRIVISEKTLAATGGESVEMKDRKTGEVSIIPLEKVKIVCSETK
ncbi:prolyl-tRNA synthetase [bacterium]|nr:prolyl-tRNA synthetase [bacterium]